MASTRGILARRKRRTIRSGFDLQLTSMLDVLVIILIFLLKNYNVSMNQINTPKDLQLPVSTSQNIPTDTILVTVTLDSLSVGQTVLTSTELDEEGRRIAPLFTTLTQAREKAEALLADKKSLFDGIIAIQADKKVPYDKVRKVMYTASSAGFKVFRFLAAQKD
jgi:biopolymer transport protein ExbD